MTMNSERLGALIEAYGAWTDRWPEAERNAALAALAVLPEADDDLRAAQALDNLLDSWRLEPVPAGLAARIEARALAQRGPIPRREAPLRRLVIGGRRRAIAWMSSAGLAAACAAGVMVGVRLGDVGVAHAGDIEAVGNLLDGVTAFGAPVDLEKSG